jgi:CIC family chloride channel protein
MYAGATFGEVLRRRFPRLVIERRTLIAAGAAAGVAAIFKAPATGLVFALEVPYRDDLARRILLPASVASASGYLAFAAIHGTMPLFTIEGAPRFSMGELGVALLLGVVAGVGARIFTVMIRYAKRSQSIHPIVRIPAAAAQLALLFVIARIATGESLSMTSGYMVIGWALDPKRTLAVLAVVLAVRCAGTALTVAGSGVGGLFIPLVVAGALTGRIASELTSVGSTTLLTVIGTAAFLGAGYRVPLAAVMFVAESTGRPGFIVPGLLAAVAAELVMGDSSMTAYQVASGRVMPAGE